MAENAEIEKRRKELKAKGWTPYQIRRYGDLNPDGPKRDGINLPHRDIAGYIERDYAVRERGVIYADGAKDLSKKIAYKKPEPPNPARLILATLGNLEFFCYPYPLENLNYVYVSDGEEIIARIDVRDVAQGFKLASRLRSIRHFRDNGIQDKTRRSVFKKEFLKAFDFGLEADNAKALTKNPLLIATTREGEADERA